jgi:hypothetical protein
MKRIGIKEKLDQIQCPLSSISLGEFDQIGEFTAKKARSASDPLFKTAGAFFRPNYERGILISSLIKRFEVKSFLEIGFGRGYASLCAARAMCDMGWDDAAVYSVDVKLDENHLKMLTQIFPKEWFGKLNLIQGTINDALIDLPKSVDMVYIDGDHTFEGVQYDWLAIKDRFNKFVLFDDYDPRSTSDGMQVARFIDSLQDEDKELIISDRRIFFDDRRMSDDEIEYGQVLIRNKSFDVSQFLLDW